MFNSQNPPAPGSPPAGTTGQYNQGYAPPASETFDDRFIALMTLYWPAIRRYLLRLTGEVTLADDLTQETFFRAYRSFPIDRNSAVPEIRSWLYKIATNLAISHTRYKIRHACLSIEELAEKGAGNELNWADSTFDPLDRSLEAEESREVVATLSTLPTAQVVLLLLRFYQDLGYDEIARALGIKEEAVRARVHRARQAFIRQYNRFMEGRR